MDKTIREKKRIEAKKMKTELYYNDDSIIVIIILDRLTFTFAILLAIELFINRFPSRYLKRFRLNKYFH